MRQLLRLSAWAMLSLLLPLVARAQEKGPDRPAVVIGSKAFTESVIICSTRPVMRSRLSRTRPSSDSYSRSVCRFCCISRTYP